MQTNVITIEVLRDPGKLSEAQLQRALVIARALGSERLVLCQPPTADR